MKYAEIKFNGGRGALLCNGCSVIIAEGTSHEDRLHFCDECSDILSMRNIELYDMIRKWRSQNKILDELAKMDQELF